MDCGAYDGDSVEQYLQFTSEVNAYKRVYAFEPDEGNYQRLVEKYGSNKSIECIKKGVWNKETVLSFCIGNDMSSYISENEEGDVRIGVVDIDSVVGDTKVGFIKMDVEGSELEALRGAEKTILRDHPVLAISAYHKKQDLFELPKYIKSLEDGRCKYDLYLRHHAVCAAELVLYAIPNRS